MKRLFFILIIAVASMNSFAETSEIIGSDGVTHWTTNIDNRGTCSQLSKVAKTESREACFELTLNMKDCKTTVVSTEKYLKAGRAINMCAFFGGCSGQPAAVDVQNEHCRVKVITVQK